MAGVGAFDDSFDRLMGNEGGYVNNPNDPGGETQWGVTWPVLHQAVAAGLVANGTTIRGLTREQARSIYKGMFWDRGQMDQYDHAIAFQVFDAAVNHGIETALRLLQRASGVADDGHMGPVTVAAVRAKTVTAMLMLFMAERIEFWAKLTKWDEFGRGWARRAAKDLRYAAGDS